MKGPDIFKLVISLLVCQAAGFLGSLATTPSIPNWYRNLAKPSFTPPSWVFGPAWVTLYVMMGIALFLVWRRGAAAPGVKTALILFFIQLALNSLWSVLFFGLHQPFWAFIEIIILWIFILLTLIAFWRISLPAGLLLLPYLLWVTFASALNFAIWRLN
ncbi:MAG: tryptophan-rich sensory protein [Candidatus Aminicenantes bacterium]|nr:tryptophan-rich sensory protein [Candidatus Aminicenantes bacterium]